MVYMRRYGVHLTVAYIALCTIFGVVRGGIDGAFTYGLAGAAGCGIAYWIWLVWRAVKGE